MRQPLHEQFVERDDVGKNAAIFVTNEPERRNERAADGNLRGYFRSQHLLPSEQGLVVGLIYSEVPAVVFNLAHVDDAVVPDYQQIDLRALKWQISLDS